MPPRSPTRRITLYSAFYPLVQTLLWMDPVEKPARTDLMSSNGKQRTSLVTGGAGFIGSHLVETLIARGDQVVVVDNLSTGRQENLVRVDGDQLTFIAGTVSETIEQLNARDFSEMYHLAAAVGVRLVIEKPIHTIETNVHETSAMLNFAAKHSTPLLIASTSEVYGKSTKSPFAEDDDVMYGPTIFSRWSYACSKAIDEYLALAYHRQHQLPVTIVRFFNTIGPRQVGHYGMVLPRFVAAAIAGETLQVHGDGKQTRCFCDVRDVVRILTKMLSNPKCTGKVLNLGSEHSISIRDLAQLVCDTLGSSSRIEYIPYEQAFGEGFDDLRDRRPDLTRLREATGFQPTIDLEQTIRDLAEDMATREAASMESGV